MDLFQPKIDKKRIAYSNLNWNMNKFNAPWNVGYTVKLIKDKNFNTINEWIDYYFSSGEERLKEIEKLSPVRQTILKGKKPHDSIPERHLNYKKGRTKEEVKQIGRELYQSVLKTGNKGNLTKNECIYIAFYRILCETWNGIMVREKNSKKLIEEYFMRNSIQIHLVDTFAEFDDEYAVDFEFYKDGQIYCGIQVKPTSYRANKDYLIKAKQINKTKNEKYYLKFNRPIFYIYSNENGEISNIETLKDMLNFVNNPIKKCV